LPVAPASPSSPFPGFFGIFAVPVPRNRLGTVKCPTLVRMEWNSANLLNCHEH
jgi:hypothetical protein